MKREMVAVSIKLVAMEVVSVNRAGNNIKEKYTV